MDIGNNQRKPTGIFRKLLKNKKSITGITIFIIGYTLTMLSFTYAHDITSFNSEAILNLLLKAIPITVGIIGVGYMLFGYLEGDRDVSKIENEEFSNQNSQNFEVLRIDLRKYLEELLHRQERERYDSKQLLEKFREEMHKQNEIRLNERQQEDIFNSFRRSFSENINEDFFKRLNENISIDLTKEKRGRLEFLMKDFSSIKSRLYNEIEKLNRKANINLVIGSLTTIVAFIALGFIVFQFNGKFTSYGDMLFQYVPRLSLIIFIEVFAYFFLRLYKLNLDDMKYFQNELTTVELKLSSIITAINFGKDIDITAITLEFAKTERNFILKKGETTVGQVCLFWI